MAGMLTLCSTTACEGLFRWEEDDLYINSHMHQVAPQSVVSTPGALEEFTGPAGITCSNVNAGSGTGSSGGTSGGIDAGDFWMQEETDSEGLSMVVGTFDEVLERRSYDRGFISAHEVERFTVTTRSGAQYSFTYWGSDTCEPCPPGDFEPLPGDPWGCGTTGSESAPNEGANPGVPSVDAQR